jgi:hypothetical protein
VCSSLNRPIREYSACAIRQRVNHPVVHDLGRS